MSWFIVITIWLIAVAASIRSSHVYEVAEARAQSGSSSAKSTMKYAGRAGGVYATVAIFLSFAMVGSIEYSGQF